MSKNKNESRICIIREELIAITDNHKEAGLLNQWIYWSDKTKDAKQYFKEEGDRINPYEITNNDDLKHGWIYKSVEELLDETMLKMSPKTCYNILKKFIQKGWINRRRNPKFKWDRTYQYRVNLLKIAKDLKDIGYQLHWVKLPLRSGKITESKWKSEPVRSGNSTGTIPKTTTKNISKNITRDLNSSDSSFNKSYHISPHPETKIGGVPPAPAKRQNTKNYIMMDKLIKMGAVTEDVDIERWGYDDWFDLMLSIIQDRSIPPDHRERIVAELPVDLYDRGYVDKPNFDKLKDRAYSMIDTERIRLAS